MQQINWVSSWNISQWLQDPLILQVIGICVALVPIIYFTISRVIPGAANRVRNFPFGLYRKKEVLDLRAARRLMNKTINDLRIENAGLKSQLNGEERVFQMAFEALQKDPAAVMRFSEEKLGKDQLTVGKKPTIDRVAIAKKES